MHQNNFVLHAFCRFLLIFTPRARRLAGFVRLKTKQIKIIIVLFLRRSITIHIDPRGPSLCVVSSFFENVKNLEALTVGKLLLRKQFVALVRQKTASDKFVALKLF